MALTSPRRWGDVARRHRMTCQGLLVLGKRPGASEDSRRYFMELAKISLQLLQRAEAIDPEAPRPGKTSLVPCSSASCEATVEAGAHAVWMRRPLWTLCVACQERCSPVQGVRCEPWTPQEREAAASRYIARVIELDPVVFSLDESPEALARFTAGHWDRACHALQANASALAFAVGEDEAGRRLAEARESAGTASLLAHWDAFEPPPEPEAEPEPEYEVHEAPQGRQQPQEPTYHPEPQSSQWEF